MRIFIKTWHGIIFILTITLFFVSFPIAFLLYGRKKYWLISEVDFDARDNGFHFFKYLNREHKEIETLFLISKKNPNYQLVKRIGKTLEPKTYKHMLIFIASRAKISTLVHGCSPSWCVTKYLVKHHSTGKNIALKHGIFKNLHPNYFKKNAHLDLICCGGKPEFDFINNNFGYQDGIAKYTGLARFDSLHNLKTTNEVFIMPTWRRWLDQINSAADFEQTEYYKNWLFLLNNPQFLKLIKDNKLSVCFYIHPKLNKFKELFHTKDSAIKFLNSAVGDDIQDHLKNASILITDFSSIFFDFAYMRKPAIYYQFDEKQYFDTHYKKAYFDYRDNGFGPVAQNIEGILNELHNIVKNGYRMANCYYKRAIEFFPLYDTKNCERIFNAISEVVSK